MVWWFAEYPLSLLYLTFQVTVLVFFLKHMEEDQGSEYQRKTLLTTEDPDYYMPSSALNLMERHLSQSESIQKINQYVQEQPKNNNTNNDMLFSNDDIKALVQIVTQYYNDPINASYYEGFQEKNITEHSSESDKPTTNGATIHSPQSNNKNGHKPFFCVICNTNFIHLDNIIDHLRVHGIESNSDIELLKELSLENQVAQKENIFNNDGLQYTQNYQDPNNAVYYDGLQKEIAKESFKPSTNNVSLQQKDFAMPKPIVKRKKSLKQSNKSFSRPKKTPSVLDLMKQYIFEAVQQSRQVEHLKPKDCDANDDYLFVSRIDIDALVRLVIRNHLEKNTENSKTNGKTSQILEHLVQNFKKHEIARSAYSSVQQIDQSTEQNDENNGLIFTEDDIEALVQLVTQHYKDPKNASCYKEYQEQDNDKENLSPSESDQASMISIELPQSSPTMPLNQNPYICYICESNSTSFNSLVNHLRTHRPGPEICKYCGAKFNSYSKLVEHERIHTKIQSFVCQICEISYATKGGLSRHNKQKHFEN